MTEQQQPTTPVTPAPSAVPMVSNVNIDFSKKSNPRPQRSYGSHDRGYQRRDYQPRRAPIARPVGTTPQFEIGKDETPVRIAALGGLEQVGENMMFVEYKDDLLVIDAGMVMPGGEMYGVDYVIPDIAYLKQNRRKIKGILITHGHLDHIGALKHVLPDLGFPTVYSSHLTIMMIKKALEEVKMIKDFKYKIVDPDVDIIKLGCFTAEFFRVNHNIPESMGIAIHTPKGLMVTTGDYKIDFTPAIDKPADLAKIARIGQEGVKVMFGESTNATKPGRTPSEKGIGDTLESIIKTANTRLIIATFASNVGRLIQIINSAVKYNKVVFLAGRSMVNVVEIVTELGYINVPKGMIRKMSSEVDSLPDERVVILSTGSQGEEFSALQRIAKGEHPHVTLRQGDKIVMSATAIPGNERAVIDMINEFIKKGVDVVQNSDMDIHASGHGYQEDIKMMISMLKPEHMVPIHGELFMRNANRRLGLEMGIPSEKIFLLENGSVLEMYDNGVKVSDKKIRLDTVLIDGLGVGHLSGEYVMKARKIMADDGVLALIFKVDTKSKELVGNIQIESRGFVYSSEVKKIHTNIVHFAQKKYYDNLRRVKETRENLRMLKDELTEYITKTIGRVPMILPMFVYINRDGSALDPVSEDEAILGMTLEEQGNVDETTDPEYVAKTSE